MENEIPGTPEQQPNQDSSKPIRTSATKTPYDYYQLLQAVSRRGKEIYGERFFIEDIDRPVVLKLLAYFLRDGAIALEEGLDLRKGIMLTGPVGCGKTSLINITREFSEEVYRPVIVPCREIAFEFNRTGFDVIARYSKNAFHAYTSIPRVHCFDDLGLEAPANYWGNNTSVMAEILLSRYDFFISHKMLTHVTTNLNSQELEAAYGNRIRSRMRAMFNLVAFNPASTDKRR